jgi:hypothetical protein
MYGPDCSHEFVDGSHAIRVRDESEAERDSHVLKRIDVITIRWPSFAAKFKHEFALALRIPAGKGFVPEACSHL